ncbi:hypothetical protein ACE38W_03890 [Chitinophaga sp. Hz27]|uniref:hypothetical protein n=1 Tax=Chitinophaga sp. Hz27 TaxID=3347169 RepID=UPI0035DA2FB4
MNFNDVSERYSKFLIAVRFSNHDYFTVFGTDKTAGDVDKLLVDEAGNLLLFTTRSELSFFIEKSDNLFDIKHTKEWACSIQETIEAYYVLDLDIFKLSLDIDNEDMFDTLYTTIGIVEDYARQVNNKSLLTIFNSAAMLTFYDEMSDYFLWAKTDILSTTVDLAYLAQQFGLIYKLLECNIKVSGKIY